MELTHLQVSVGKIIREFIAWWWQQPDSSIELEKYLEQYPQAFDELEQIDAFKLFSFHFGQPKHDADIEELIAKHAGIIFPKMEPPHSQMDLDIDAMRTTFIMAARYGYDIHKSIREDLQMMRSRFEELANKWATENEILEKENKSLKKKILKNETEKTTAAKKSGKETGMEVKKSAEEEKGTDAAVDTVPALALFGNQDQRSAAHGAGSTGKE
jgi:hypothetical protein